MNSASIGISVRWRVAGSQTSKWFNPIQVQTVKPGHKQNKDDEAQLLDDIKIKHLFILECQPWDGECDFKASLQSDEHRLPDMLSFSDVHGVHCQWH